MISNFRGIQPTWDPNFMVSPAEFSTFCSGHLRDQTPQILFVAAIGFDPRACTGCETLNEERGEQNFDAILVEVDEGRTSPSQQHDELIERNRDRFADLLEEADSVVEETIEIWEGQGLSRRRANPRTAQQILPSPSELYEYDAIIFDISAMPKSIMFSILGKAITICSQERIEDKEQPELYALVSEDPSLDIEIEPRGPEDSATYIPGYGISLEQEATIQDPTIWIPVLGEKRRVPLQVAHDTIEPREVLPVLPSPSQDPRMADNLLNEYHDLLFDKWLVEPTNFIYASESNPFDLYRQILRVGSHYRDALGPVGKCKFAVTVTSSKLLSIGAMLGVLDLKWHDFSTGLAQVRYDGYRMSENQQTPARDESDNLYCIGLSGKPYTHDGT